jgi:hypothetical protein
MTYAGANAAMRSALAADNAQVALVMRAAAFLLDKLGRAGQINMAEPICKVVLESGDGVEALTDPMEVAAILAYALEASEATSTACTAPFSPESPDFVTLVQAVAEVGACCTGCLDKGRPCDSSDTHDMPTAAAAAVVAATACPLCHHSGGVQCALACSVHAPEAWWRPSSMSGYAQLTMCCLAPGMPQVVARQNGGLAGFAAQAKDLAKTDAPVLPPARQELLDALVARQHCRMEGCFAVLPPGSTFNKTNALDLWQVGGECGLQQLLPHASPVQPAACRWLMLPGICLSCYACSWPRCSSLSLATPTDEPHHPSLPIAGSCSAPTLAMTCPPASHRQTTRAPPAWSSPVTTPARLTTAARPPLLSPITAPAPPHPPPHTPMMRRTAQGRASLACWVCWACWASWASPSALVPLLPS